MGIKIGDKNKFNNSNLVDNSTIINSFSSQKEASKKPFIERHPLIISFLISIITGIILLFSFWKTLINWIEDIIK